MITEDHIRATFRGLRAMGLTPPAAWLPADASPAALAESRAVAREATALWAATLADLTPEELHQATLAWLRASRFWPTPAQLLELVPRRRLDAAEPSAAAGLWTRLLRLAASRGGAAGPPAVYLDPTGPEAHLEGALRAGVEAVGGWRALCASTPDDWLRKRFVEAFDAAAEQAGVRRELDALGQLPASVAAFIGGASPLADRVPPVDLRALARRDSREAVFRDRADGDAPYDLGAK